MKAGRRACRLDAAPYALRAWTIARYRTGGEPAGIPTIDGGPWTTSIVANPAARTSPSNARMFGDHQFE